MVVGPWYINPILWIWICVAETIIVIGFIILIIIMRIFTHGFQELKAKIKGIPICLFFEDSRYAKWKPIKPEGGLIQDDDYGSYIINEKGSYVDRDTKNIYLPFDAGFASGASIKAFKMSDDLHKVFKDESKLSKIRVSLMRGELDKSELEGLRESVNFSHLRSLSNTIIPHNITAKIEKTIAQRMSGLNKVNVPQIALLFAAVLGACVIAFILIRMFGKG